MKQTIILLIVFFVISVYAQEVSVFRTDGNGSERLAPQNSFELSDGTINNANITINESQIRQSVEGFGFTLTNGSAETFMTLSTSKRTEVLNEIFNPITGINSSMVRIPIGSCDLASDLYSYNDNPGDTDMSEFNFGPDANHLIPILKEIKQINPNVKILATPWSAPKWMKTEDKWDGGLLRDEMMDTYALYIKTYLEKMNDEGLTVWGITVQNEPLNSYNHPAMYMDANQQIDFIENHLKNNIQNLPFGSPKVIGYDHNCDNTNYPIAVANGSDFVDGTAFHLYDNQHNISALSTVYNATGKDIYFTEQYTGGYASFDGDLGWHAEKVVIGSLRNWSKTVFTWNMSSYTDFSPRTHSDVCSDCQGAIIVNNGGYIKKVAYYIIGQLSKFVEPGAVVLNTSGDGYYERFSVALRNPDGSKVLLFYNEISDQDRQISVNIGGKSFTYAVPSRSFMTFKWNDAATQPPTAPTDLVANGEGSKVTLSWTPSETATSYEIYRATSQNGSYQVIDASVLNVNYTDTDVLENVTYYYKIKAKNIAGSSSYSNTASAQVIPFIQLIPDGEYVIYSDVQGQVITAPDNPVSNAYMSYEENGNDKQRWVFTHIAEDVYTIYNKNTGKYMGIKDNWCGNLGEVVPNSTLSDDNNLFKIVSPGNNQIAFQLAYTNCSFGSQNVPTKAWDVENGGANANVRTYEYINSNPNQHFELAGLILGYEMEDYSNNISVYPVPSQGIITLFDHKNNSLNGSINIIDLNGRIIYSSEVSSNNNQIELNLEDQEEGIYYLQYHNERELITKKILLK